MKIKDYCYYIYQSNIGVGIISQIQTTETEQETSVCVCLDNGMILKDQSIYGTGSTQDAAQSAFLTAVEKNLPNVPK